MNDRRPLRSRSTRGLLSKNTLLVAVVLICILGAVITIKLPSMGLSPTFTTGDLSHTVRPVEGASPSSPSDVAVSEIPATRTVGGSGVVGALVSLSPPMSRCADATDCLSCLFVGMDARGGVSRRSDGGGQCGWCASMDKCVPLYAGTTIPPPNAGQLDVLLSPSGVGGASKDAKDEDNPINNNGAWYANEGSTAGTTCSYCVDMEWYACPAVLHTPIPTVHRVLHVAIRKGGPEALVQLHLALNDWGFKTTLDTRKSKKEKGGVVVPFFMESYRDEFARAPPLRWSLHYDNWHETAAAGDLLIGTETWGCRKTFKTTPSPLQPSPTTFSAASLFPSTGIRQMQWHLTVWPRRDRSSCTISGHTDYVTFDYMRQSRRALLFPYISPHILRLAAATHLAEGSSASSTTSTPPSTASKGKSSSRSSANELRPEEQSAILAPQYSLSSKKDALVLYDSDTKLTNDDLQRKARTQHDTKIATGYTPTQLYALYAKAKAGIDLRLPGGERFIYEASLFDVCVIVDKSLNGGNAWDFPIPDRFKPDMGEGALMKAPLVDIKDKCLEEHATLFPSSPDAPQPFNDIKRHVLLQRPRFYRHVRRYYSNSVRVVTYAGNDGDFNGAKVISFVLATLIQIPLATIDVLFPSAVSLSAFLSSNEVALGALRDDSLLAAVVFRVVCGSGPSMGSSTIDVLRADIKSGSACALSARLWGASTALAAKSSLYLLALPLNTFIVGGNGGGGGSNADAVHLLGSIRALLVAKNGEKDIPAVLLGGYVGGVGDAALSFMFGTVSDVISALSKTDGPIPVQLSSELTSEIFATAPSTTATPTSAFLCTHGLFSKYGGAHAKCSHQQ